jgi:hypothetical protein
VKVKPLDFLVIGTPKSGTTSLFHYLKQHPKIYLPPQKELPFFNNEQLYAKGWDQFALNYFSRASIDTLWGKITPQYMAYYQVPPRLFELMPRVRLVALLRNPIDRAFSHYRMALRENTYTGTFEEMISNQIKSSSINPLLTHGEYGENLDRFLSYFPQESLLIIFTTDLAQRPQSVLDAILLHLGLKPEFYPKNLGQHYHKGGTRQRWPWLIPLARKTILVWWLFQRLPETCKQVVKLRLYTTNIVPTPPPPLDPGLRRKLVKYYRSDVRKLEALIGRKTPWAEFHEESLMSNDPA